MVRHSGIRSSCSRKVAGDICCKKVLQGRRGTGFEQGKCCVRVSKFMLELGDFGLVFGDLFKKVFIGKGGRSNGLAKQTTTRGDFMLLGGFLQEGGGGWVFVRMGFMVDLLEVGNEEVLVWVVGVVNT